MRAKRGMVQMRDVEPPCKSLARFADNQDTVYDADKLGCHFSREFREDVVSFFFLPQTNQNDMSLIYFGAVVNPLIGNLVKLIVLDLRIGSCSHLIQIHDVSKLAYFQNKRLMYYPNVVLTPQAP